MSSIWTPYGEHEPGREPGTPSDAGPAPEPEGDDLSEPGATEADPELAAQMHELREQLAATPVTDIVANHAVGLWQLAIVHMAPEEGAPVRLDEASLAIDAMATLVEGLGDRLGQHESPLRDALAQLRLVYVQVSKGDDRGTAGSGASTTD